MRSRTGTNRPGAVGNVGSEIVARAPPDGYTWLIVATPDAINESLYSHLGFSLGPSCRAHPRLYRSVSAASYR